MRLTIIKGDKAIYVNGVCFDGIDMSWIPTFDGNEFHALQWYDDHGEIEFTTPIDNLKIKELGVFEQALPLWEARRQEILEYEQEQVRLREEAEAASIAYQKQMEERINNNAVNEYEDEDIYYNIEELLKEI